MKEKKKLEMHFEADSVEDLFRQIFTAAKYLEMNKDKITDDIEESVECEECHKLKDAVEDLQKAIATLTYYDLPVPPELADKYNDAREEFLDYPCPHEDDKDEDD